MKYSLIDNKDVIVSIDENIEKLEKLKDDTMSIIPSEPHHKKGLNLNTYTVMTNKEKIEKLLKESLKQDRAKTQVEGFTKLNLMELTRKHICSHNS